MFFFDKRKIENNMKKQLVIITGCAGSGKTTIGREIAKAMNYSYVDKDTVTREFTDFILTELGSYEGDRESAIYKEKILPIEYRISLKLCRELLDCGSSVVLTIPFINQIQDYTNWQKIKRTAKISDDVKVKFIWIEHNIDTEKANIINRNATRDKYKIENWENYALSVEGIEPAKEYEVFLYVNDCETNLSEAIEEVIAWIKK